MPTRLAAPVLTVDIGKLHNIDTRNVENLFSMWTDSIEEGRRLENLSWRLWNRQTFCCDVAPAFHRFSDLRHRESRERDMPRLSSSVDTAFSDDYDRLERHHNGASLVAIRSLSSNKVSAESLSSNGRARAKPISSQALEKMVISIKETKISERHDMTGLPTFITEAVHSLPAPSADHPTGSASALRPDQPPSPKRRLEETRASHSSTSTVPPSSPESAVARSQTFGSETSAEFADAPGVVRGFTPTSISSYRMASHPTVAEPKPIKPSSLRPEPALSALKGGRVAKFQLGAAGSSDEEASSVEEQMSLKLKSKLTAGLRQPSLDARKQTSFKDEVESRTVARKFQDSDVFEESDDEDDDVSESAIEDGEDSSDWEDSASDAGEEHPPEKQLFQRVDSKPNLVSRQSLLTTMMHQSERANAMAGLASRSQPALHRSRTASPSGPSVAASPEEESFLGMQGANITRSKPIIMTTSNTHHPALSPRTTRRNMLATELTESLRKHLLWERQQKNTTANAVLKRRHTSHDVANLQQYPDADVSGTTSKNNSWNHYFDHGLGEYHSKGW